MNRLNTKVMNATPVRYQTPKQSNICYMAFRVTYWVDGVGGIREFTSPVSGLDPDRYKFADVRCKCSNVRCECSDVRYKFLHDKRDIAHR
jgi:hypothetical protein